MYSIRVLSTCKNNNVSTKDSSGFDIMIKIKLFLI